jgi:hypothetical protein
MMRLLDTVCKSDTVLPGTAKILLYRTGIIPHCQRRVMVVLINAVAYRYICDSSRKIQDRVH